MRIRASADDKLAAIIHDTIASTSPGESTGSFALESALDELAHVLQIDPI